jgi:predicted phosphodiesterase
MRYAIISDIHGNVDALKAVLRDIEKRGVDSIICLGDIVGYYPDPELCVRIVKKYVTYSVAGNHDYAAVGKIDHSNFTFFAYVAMEWTKKNISDASREFLSSLPLVLRMDGMFFTHSSPGSPNDFSRYVFPDSEEAIFEAFSSLVHRVNFIGHTHWPSIMLQNDDRIMLHNEQTIEVDDRHYYLINVGSVGQPRNFDPRSCYALYDTGAARISLIYVEYDFTITQKKVIKHNLPHFLAFRLSKGR